MSQKTGFPRRKLSESEYKVIKGFFNEYPNVKAASSNVINLFQRSSNTLTSIKHSSSWADYCTRRDDNINRSKTMRAAKAKQVVLPETVAPAASEDVGTVLTLLNEMRSEMKQHYKLCHAEELAKMEQRTGTFSKLFSKGRK